MADIKARPRTHHWFTIPAKLVADCGGYEKVCFVELTANDELAVASRVGNQALKLGWEMARESLRLAVKAGTEEVISTGDHTVDLFWNAVGSQCRQMLMAAFGKVHGAKPEDTDDFLKSCEVRVG